jgi:transcriptional regulator with AAA-type ATPase domain/tetratricopeptide (TPR) repeat protein
MNDLMELMGRSPAIQTVRADIRKLVGAGSAHRPPAILIQGETGTGKGLVAKLLHGLGPRRDGVFVEVNCAAIPDTLLEAEFFGYERGAFTDARRSKPGLFQTAHRGTIFLDEIGLLPEILQAKLLKVVEERSVRRLGAIHSENVDVWIISATNTDVVRAIRTGKFRADLYHRLAVLTLALPPLRERGDDALLLAEHFLARASSDYGLPTRTLSADARTQVLAYRWPGNVRELANAMERAALLAQTSEVTAAALELTEGPATATTHVGRSARALPLDTAVQQHVEAALDETSWNISRTAAILGISRNTLRSHIRKFGLRAPVVAPRAPADPLPPSGVDTGQAVVGSGEAPTASREGALRWERRRIAALATSLEASTDLAAFQLASTQYDLIEKLRSFGARVEELTPISMVALFGLQPMEDAASRAAHAALAMLKALERDRTDRLPAVNARFAIHAGRCLIAQGVDLAGMDSTERQEVRTRLDRLLQGAEPNTIVADDAAAEFLRRGFDLEKLGAIAGTSGPSYRVTKPKGLAFQAGGRGLSPFVGREQDLSPLRRLLEQAEGGRGHVVGIMGEPGVGKSRLLHEFRQSLAPGRVTYLDGRCHSYGSTIPYFPIVDIIRSTFEIGELDTPELVGDKVRSGLHALALDAREWAPYVLHLLGIKEESEMLAALSPEAVKARTMELLRQLCLRGSSRRPIIIAIEDMHWIDRTSEEALSALVAIVATCPILLVATYRPGYRPPWLDRSQASQFTLRGLAASDSLAIVRSVIPAQRLPRELEQTIVSRAEGGPFLLEELARAVVEHPELGSDVAVPETIQDVLVARLDRLPSEDRELLQTASVIGKDVNVAIFRAVSDVPEAEFGRQLARLEAAEFLYERNTVPKEYSFKHALTHEVAYQSVLESRRRALDARVVEAIETIYADRRSEWVDRLAHHAFRGEDWEKSIGYLRRAGERALASSANREATEFFGQALQALSHLPQTPSTLEQAIDVRLNLRDALWALAEVSKIQHHLRETEILGRALGDRRREGWIACYLCQYSWAVVDLDAALDTGERALAIADSLPDRALRAETSFYLGLVYLARGDASRAAAIFSTNLHSLDEVIEAHRREFPSRRFAANGSILVRGWMPRVLAEIGDFADGEAWGHEAVRLGEAGDRPFALTAALTGLGILYGRKGEPGRAIPLLQRALDLCRDYRFNNWFPTVAASLGHAHASLGQLEPGLALLENAVDRGARAGIVSSHSLWLVYLAEACLLAQRASDSLVHGRRALALSREHNERGYEAWALRLLADVASRADPPDLEEAENKYGEAMALAERLEMLPLVARCQLELGDLYERAGDHARAATYHARGRGLCRDLEMPLPQDRDRG